MQRLAPDEIADLGEFLSRRLPSPSAAGWPAFLLEAQESGRLGAVLGEASRHSDDPRLREVHALFAPRVPRRSGAFLAAVGVACTFGLLVVGVVGGAVFAAFEAEAVAVVPAPPAAPAPAVVAEVVVETRAPEPQPVASALADHPCARAGEGIVGWWYAGSRSPGRAGDVIAMSRDANVRVTAPGADNRFNARTRVRCVLSAGDRVRLSEDPLLVPPGAYWVPLRAEDIAASSI